MTNLVYVELNYYSSLGHLKLYLTPRMLSSKLALPSLVPVGIFSRQVFSECPPNLFQSPFQDITSYNFHVFSISTQNQPPSQKVDCYFFPANKKIILSFLSIKSAKKKYCLFVHRSYGLR